MSLITIDFNPFGNGLMPGRKKSTSGIFFVFLLWLHFFIPIPLSAQSEEPRPQNILLLVIDALRADHLGSYGYERNTSPNLDALAAEGTKFEYCFSPAPVSPSSIASLFTSFYPTVHQVGYESKIFGMGKKIRPRQVIPLNEKFLTLAEALKGAGYRTAIITSNAQIQNDWGFGQGFDDFYKMFDQPANQINQKAYEFLNQMSSAPNPFFLFIHYLDPHTPYTAPPGHLLFQGDIKAFPYSRKAQDEIRQYDGEIHNVDSEIGKLFAFLKERHLYDSTLVIVTADHGEQFYEKGIHGHSLSLFHTALHVPLIMKAPGMERAKTDRMVSLIDIYPTLLEIVGLPVEPSIQGRSLKSPENNQKNPGVMSEMTMVREDQKRLREPVEMEKAYIDPDGNKLILSFIPAAMGRAGKEFEKSWAVYQIKKDPFERKKIRNRLLYENLHSAFYQLYNESFRIGRSFTTEAVSMDPQAREALRSLGYIQE